MSGHSKWHSIKHKKAATDAKRGKVFTKIIREITTSARAGGGDEATNIRLRTVLLKAKAANMPADTIKKAVMRGTGELEGVSYEEGTYEGYGPGGAAILVEVLTDNKNRTAAEMRFVVTRNHGNLGEPGSVAWQFKMRGLLTFSADSASEDEIMEALLEAGVDDIAEEAGVISVECDPGAFDAVKGAADQAGLKYESAEVTKLPQNYIQLSADDARKAMKLVEALEDHDDVQNVYTNFDVPEEILQEA